MYLPLTYVNNPSSNPKTLVVAFEEKTSQK